LAVEDCVGLPVKIRMGLWLFLEEKKSGVRTSISIGEDDDDIH
jgi:hypothetical protein